MSRPGPDDRPDRLYTLTSGRSRPSREDLDLVTLIVAESGPAAGLSSELATILRLCVHPTSVVEISAELGLPVSITKILVSDLLDAGRATARHPRYTASGRPELDPATLEKVLVGLRAL
ncbi:DUF742 domain-containing protein [Streptomyces sp. UH6]|uniref:DUF742 domain-containing protein n=1 Tax=Streptomyces sp. UH6 TaxID=2748379 RepID=UPI0015D4C020|nr:DUF742 domain-containing protein [Streptomyces sp. UH6]NYV76677.1 DUF742 domain-containing protein [Streptomyces sp. UH6]